MKKLIAVLVTLCVCAAAPIWAANTVTGANTRAIEVSAIDSDWDSGKNLRLIAIVFVPGASDDVAVVKNGSATGPTIFYAKSTDGEPRVQYYFGGSYQPLLDYGDCTLTAGAKIILIVER